MYNSHFFDGDAMLAWMRALPGNTFHVADEMLRVPNRVAIMTHDDAFDETLWAAGVDAGIEPTFFLFDDDPGEFPDTADIQFHYRMDGPPLAAQLDRFVHGTGRIPFANRNHRTFWRADHLNLAHLAMHGFTLDCTRPGTKPYRPCVEGRLLPIWELPFSVVDDGYVSVTRGVYPTYNLAADMKSLFLVGVSPIVGLFHPQHQRDSRWRRFYEYAHAYDYTLLNVTEFYERYCR